MKKILSILICVLLAVPSMWAGEAKITASVSGASTGTGEVVASTSSSAPSSGWTSGTSGPVSNSGILSRKKAYAYARTLETSASEFSHWIVDNSSTASNNPYSFESGRTGTTEHSVAAVFYKIIDCKTTEVNIMKKYVCEVCGWVYDEEEGAPDMGIEPGTEFEDLPDDFECPLCGVGKDNFSEE